MKNKFLVAILIIQAVSLTHIYHLEAGNKNKMPSFLYKEQGVENKFIPALNNAPKAELLPDIGSFEDSLNAPFKDDGPQGELFPDVAQVKPVKKKR